MPEFKTLREAFGFFGAKAVNPRWAWAAQSQDGSVVVLAMWVDFTRLENGKSIYDTRGRHDRDEWIRRPGNKDRLRKLRHVRDHCGGKFRVVHVQAVDRSAPVRSTTGKYRADADLVMTLVELNETTGEFLAISA
ncbi:hypothetical protein [Sphingomonas sp.]|uniref:hypothetical protein n=1 Tax=Sphingomonas sp. TaxID=28214 RepID=UPI001DF55734|nr:hypothetical protein [Sphingomonas sp.]MBX9797554.1 hypothetical protein [Sphingomonas sp.]